MKINYRLRHSLLAAASSLLAVSSSHAADGTWNIDTTNGLWSLNTNWSSNTIADGSGSTANFTNNITGDRTVRLDGDRTLTSLVFADSVTSSAGSWLLDNNGVSTNNLILAGTTPGIAVNELGAGKTATISAIIQGSAGLVKTGSGTLVLTGASTYTGGTTISAGTLIGTGGTGGSLSSGTVTNNAVLILNYNDQVIGNVISGSGSVRTNAGNATRHVFIGSNNSYSGGTFVDVGILRILTDQSGGTADLGTGTVTVANGASFEIWAPSAKTVTNNIVLNGATGNAGRPALNQDGGTGLVTLSGTVTLNATSDIGIGGASSNSMTITGVVSGVGGMIVDERGLTGVNRTLTLSGANTYTGPTTLNGGILKAGVASVANVSGAFGNNSAVTLANVATGPVLDITGFATQIGSLTGGGTLGGNVTLGAATLTVGGDNTSPAAYAGVISGTGGLTKIGTGTQTLSGANTYTGNTLIDNGILALGHATNTLANNGAINVNGGTLALGTNTDTVGAVTLTSGSITGSGAGRLTGTSYGVQSGTISAKLGGSGALTKTTAGTVTISSDNSGGGGYTGAIAVNAGTLIVNGNVSTSIQTTVASGATLGGTGTVGALTIQSGGTHAPGNSPGIQPVGNYTQNGILAMEINGLTAGTQHDRVDVTGTVNITGSSLSLTSTGYTAVNNDLIFILLNNDLDTITGTFAGLVDGASVGIIGGKEFKISYFANGDSAGSPSFTGGNDIALMAIPEPRASLLGAIGLIALLRRRR